MKRCPDFSPNQMALRIACGTQTTLIRKEDTFVIPSYLCVPSLHLLELDLWEVMIDDPSSSHNETNLLLSNYVDQRQSYYRKEIRSEIT
ncbi:hypothetical protein TNCV_4275041 [Trichonephila clavipes]|nr:hypothetical protein TNCV_4275041 [Trichonephila clavipes]